MDQQQLQKQEKEQSGIKVALGILGFIVGFVVLLILVKMFLF